MMIETRPPQRLDIDNGRLTGTLFQPSGICHGRVLIAGATGVPQSYYRHFAAWLAAFHGQTVLTFDYGGFAASARTAPRDCTATMADWGLGDVGAALDALHDHAAGGAITVIGHSLGGLLLSRLAGITRAARIICVASGPVHISDHPWPYRAVATSFWYGHAPLLVGSLGYLPGRLSGFGSDLPAGVYWQWRRWCTRKGSFAVDATFSAPTGPAFCGRAHFVATADDALVPPAAVWRLMQDYPEAWVSQATLPRFGHLRMFSREAQALWPTIVGPMGQGLTH